MKKLLLPLLSIMMSGTLQAHGAYVYTNAHEHGVADVTVQWKADQLSVTVAIPTYDMLGFEHMPKGAKEKRAVRDADQLFANKPFISATGCALYEVNVASALFDDHADEEEVGFFAGLFDTDKHEEASASEESVPEHIDFQATYHAICDNSNVAINVTAFALLPNLKRVRVHSSTMDAKVLQVLTPQEAIIKPIK
jgi:hypothetical protein